VCVCMGVCDCVWVYCVCTVCGYVTVWVCMCDCVTGESIYSLAYLTILTVSVLSRQQRCGDSETNDITWRETCRTCLLV